MSITSLYPTDTCPVNEMLVFLYPGTCSSLGCIYPKLQYPSVTVVAFYSGKRLTLLKQMNHKIVESVNLYFSEDDPVGCNIIKVFDIGNSYICKNGKWFAQVTHRTYYIGKTGCAGKYYAQILHKEEFCTEFDFDLVSCRWECFEIKNSTAFRE